VIIPKLRLACLGLGIAAVGTFWLSQVVSAKTHSPIPTVTDLADYNAFAADLQVGDMIFRGRNGGWGAMGSHLSDIDDRYGHVGLIVEREEEPWVVHASGDPFRAKGRVKLDRLDDFLSRSTRAGGYRLDMTGSERTALIEGIEAMLVSDMPFDQSYSLISTDSVYCTEMIWRAWQSAVGVDPLPVKTVWRGKLVIAIDDLQLAVGSRSIATIDAAR